MEASSSTPPSPTLRPAKGSLAAVGLVLAPALAAFGLYGVDGAADDARRAARREADLTARALGAVWSEALERDEFFVELENRFEGSGPLPEPISHGTESSGEGALHILAARSAIARRDTRSALEQVERARAAGLRGEALLTEVLARRGGGQTDSEIAGAVEKHIGDVAFTESVRGFSARLLVLLAAGDALDAPFVRDEASRIGAAIANGRVALPVPVDAPGPPGAVELDPTWRALRRIAAARLTKGGVDWHVTFHEERRRAWAVGMWLSNASGPGPAAAGDPGRWTIRLDDERVIAAYRGTPVDDAHWRGGTTTLARVAGALSRDTAPFPMRIELRPASEDNAARGVPLAGSELSLVVTPTDMGDAIRRAVRNERLLRGAFVGTALLLALAALASLRTLRRAEQLARLRSTFVASVSHDLRTPIASIALMAENLRSGWARGSEQRYAATIERETSRLARLVDDLLDFGRLERGLPVRIERSEVEIAPWLERFTASEGDRCREAGCSLSLELQRVPERAMLDVPALERALGNLVDNARKHAGATNIRLIAEGDPNGGRVRFEIVDDGRGVKGGDAVLEDLFTPFERRSASSGTGLGLSIVRAIARAHGGAARLERAVEGRGLHAIMTVDAGPGEAA